MSSTTLATILAQVVEEFDLGKVGLTTAAGSVTTLVDATRFAGPFAGNEWPRGSPIRITSGTRIGDVSYLSDYAPSTGTLTVLSANAFGGAPGSGASFVIGDGSKLDSFDRLIEAANRALNRLTERHMRVPLTFVPDGDLLGALITTFWSEQNDINTWAYRDLTHPTAYYSRVIRVVTNGVNGFIVGAAPMPAHPGETWDFQYFMRACDASSTALFAIINGITFDAITPTFDTTGHTFSAGNARVTSQSFIEVRGSFEVPADCTLIEIDMGGAENPATVEFGPIIMAPRGVRTYAGQAWLEKLRSVGKLWTEERRDAAGASVAGPESRAWMPSSSKLIAQDQYGWGQGFTFDGEPEFPIYADMTLAYPDLSADTDTTAAPEDLIVAATALEFFEWADRKERMKLGPDARRTRFSGMLEKAEMRWIQVNSDRNAPKRISVKKRYATA